MSKILQLIEKQYPLSKDTKENPLTILILDGHAINHITEEIKSYLENFKSIEQLSFVSCNLNSLKNFPEFPNLTKLDLSDNHFKGSDLIELVKYPKLKKLTAANNDIKTLEEVKVLEKLPLNFIDFSECPVTKIENYRQKFFELFKNLNILDMFDKEGKEIDDYGDEEEEEESENEGDAGFIEDDGEGEGEGEGDAEGDKDEKDDEDDGNANDEEGEEYEDNEEEEIENPNPAKKKKTE